MIPTIGRKQVREGGGVGGRETQVGAGEPLLHPDGSRELQRGSECVTGETGPQMAHTCQHKKPS